MCSVVIHLCVSLYLRDNGGNFALLRSLVLALKQNSDENRKETAELCSLFILRSLCLRFSSSSAYLWIWLARGVLLLLFLVLDVLHHCGDNFNALIATKEKRREVRNLRKKERKRQRVT